jgi:hypothetical protein
MNTKTTKGTGSNEVLTIGSQGSPMTSCLAWTFFAIAIMFGVAIFAVSFPIVFIVMAAALLA